MAAMIARLHCSMPAPERRRACWPSTPPPSPGRGAARRCRLFGWQRPGRRAGLGAAAAAGPSRCCSRPAARCRSCRPSPSAAGPGAFTGLRTACAVAQGLAFGPALPVLPLDSLLIVAEDARCAARRAPASTSAWRWTRAWARSMPAATAGRRRAGRCCSAPALYTPGRRWHAAWAAAAAAVRGRLGAAGLRRAAARPALRCASTPTSTAPRALLRLAQQRWRDGGGVDAAAGAAAVPARQGGADRRPSARAAARRAGRSKRS